jgi:hypothetical protein
MRPSEPERAIDREEREGLVSLPLFLLFPLLVLVILCCLQLFIFFIAIPSLQVLESLKNNPTCPMYYWLGLHIMAGSSRIRALHAAQSPIASVSAMKALCSLANGFPCLDMV